MLMKLDNLLQKKRMIIDKLKFFIDVGVCWLLFVNWLFTVWSQFVQQQLFSVTISR